MCVFKFDIMVIDADRINLPPQFYRDYVLKRVQKLTAMKDKKLLFKYPWDCTLSYDELEMSVDMVIWDLNLMK